MVPLFDLESCVVALIISLTVARLIQFCYHTFQNAYEATIMSSTSTSTSTSSSTSREVTQGGIRRFHHSRDRKVTVSYDWKLGIQSELAAEKRKNKTLSVYLDDAGRQHREIQQKMSEVVAVNNRLSRSIKDIETNAKETQFLMKECNATMESCFKYLQSMLNDNNEECRQLLEELEQKDLVDLYIQICTLYVQMLQDKLESTKNRVRDMLVSQGAKITGASLALSKISNLVKCVMKSTILANSLNEEEVRKLCKANGIKKDTKHDGIVTTDDDVNNEMEKPNVPKKPDGLVPTSAKLVMQLSSSKDKQPEMKKTDGHYFLGIMDVERRKVNDIVTMLKNELSSGVIPEEACGKIRSAIGKAILLTTKKFPQFKKLCEKNLNQSAEEQFSTNSSDLEGLMFQITDIHNTFRQIDKMRKNSWKEDAPSATNGTTALGGQSKSAPTTPEKSAYADAAAKARDEAKEKSN